MKKTYITPEVKTYNLMSKNSALSVPASDTFTPDPGLVKEQQTDQATDDMWNLYE